MIHYILLRQVGQIGRVMLTYRKHYKSKMIAGEGIREFISCQVIVRGGGLEVRGREVVCILTADSEKQNQCIQTRFECYSMILNLKQL